MNPFSRNLVFAVSTILLLTVSTVDAKGGFSCPKKITSIETENEN